MDFYDKYVMLSANNGKIYFWDMINNYVPPFNPHLFLHNPQINFSIEVFKSTDKVQDIPKNFFSCFLNKSIVEQYNRVNQDFAEFIVL